MNTSARIGFSASRCFVSARQAAALALIVLGIAGTPAMAGQFTYVSQSRNVWAFARDDLNDITMSQSFSAPDFGPFNQTAGASVGLGGGSARIESVLDPLAGLRVTIYVSVTGSTNYQQWGSATGSFTVEFDVDKTTQGIVELPISFGGGGFGLSGPEGWTPPFDPLIGPFPLPPTPVTFVPGRYVASGSVMLGATNGGNGDAISMLITIPTPGALAMLVVPGCWCIRRRRV